ncbi:MAG: hypothetical protein ND895_16865 [Pyrinomonadaceae bacterium]|nr:hypothetical protein [Pyrinomonadaceae bacterium]
MTGLLLFGVVLGIGAAYWFRAEKEVSRIFVTGTVTLVFGSLLGGVVSLLIGDFDRRRVQRAAQLEFISNVLADLKGVYDRVDRGRTLISAHQSAKTYGEQMREFIDARVTLLAVQRALRFDDRGSPILPVLSDVNQMEKYVHSLTAEFVSQYKDISRSQSVYEARMKHALDNLPAGNTKLTLPENSPWAELAELTQLKDFLLPVNDAKGAEVGHPSSYSKQFLDPLDRASDTLRKALESELA